MRIPILALLWLAPLGACVADDASEPAVEPAASQVCSTSPNSDYDGDGVLNKDEIGLDCNDPDVDDDGLPDGTELYDIQDITGAYVSTDPRHKDVFVEIHAEAAARFPPTVVDALEDFFASLPVSNPDGRDGITLHLLYTTVLPPGSDCTHFDGPTVVGGDFVHVARICAADQPDESCHGVGEIAGQKLKMYAAETDSDPSNDATEQNQFKNMHTFAHELLHNLGLDHGGDEGLNHKPNYVSLMNYRYAGSVDGSDRTIAGNALQISTGKFLDYPLDECALSERNSFEGLRLDDVEFLDDAADSAVVFSVKKGAGGPSVDWNRDGIYESGIVQADINGDCHVGEVMNDYDDAAALDLYVKAGLPGNPEPIERPDGPDAPPGQLVGEPCATVVNDCP